MWLFVSLGRRCHFIRVCSKTLSLSWVFSNSDMLIIIHVLKYSQEDCRETIYVVQASHMAIRLGQYQAACMGTELFISIGSLIQLRAIKVLSLYNKGCSLYNGISWLYTYTWIFRKQIMSTFILLDLLYGCAILYQYHIYWSSTS